MVEEGKIIPENGSNEASNIGDDIEKLRQALAEEKDKSLKFMMNWQRAEADFSNYKKRSEQEKTDMAAYANSSLILSLLPVLDDMDRAVASLPPKLENSTWVNGIMLIHRKLKSTMEKQGLTEIEAVGKQFDPNLHEAVAYLDGEEGIVINEAQKGYMLKNKVLRHSTVAVGGGKVDKSENATGENPENTNS